MKKENGMPDFVKNEEQILKFWHNDNSFEKLRKKNKLTDKYFAFLDGPITANNEMKLHHVWNRTLKDIMLKFKSMNGFDAHYQNGFDAQGLWVEVGVEKELGLKDKRDVLEYGMDKFTEKCISRVNFYADKISNQSKRLGQWMDWEHSYFTNSDDNITAIWHFLKQCDSRGWLIEKFRPMPWCSHCGTSLSEHELADSYADMEHIAVFFKLPIINSNYKMLVWTTTPWTLSSNVAIAVNPELKYVACKVASDDKLIIVCESAIKCLKKDLIEVVETFKGEFLVDKIYETCFPELEEQKFEHKIIAWDMVDATEGSGAVHIAPGCGAEDFELGETMGLPKVCPVDESGVFYNNFGFLAGLDTAEVADIIFKKLKESNKLYYTHKYMHRYPICWRCKKPLIYRLSKEWYLRADEIRPQLIAAIENIEWQPQFIKKRMLDWLNNMGDWNISRKRIYGLPLPFYKCDHCGTRTVIGSLQEFKELSSTSEVDALPHLHRPYIDDIKINCPTCHHKVKRVSEVGDCWLDAGITPFSTKKYFTDKEFWKKNFPIECVIEMKEQIRLWFYSLLFMSVTLEGVAPYNKVIGFAMLVAEDGTKFSKSGPNNISFDELVSTCGADVLRYIFASNNMQNDTRFGMNICDEVKRKLLGLWNTYVFYNTYATIDNPNLNNFIPNVKSLDITDKWLIQTTNNFAINAANYYEKNEYYLVTKEFETYIDDVSNWYIRVNRRRFWKSDNELDKTNAYFCLYYAIKNTISVMAPIIPFMSEYIWQNLVKETEENSASSIIIGGYPTEFVEVNSQNLLSQTAIVRNVITIAQRLRNENQLKIKQPLKTLYINANEETKNAAILFENVIKEELNIKNIIFETDNNKFNDSYLTVNFKTAGSVLKGDVQKVKQYLQDATPDEMNNLLQQYATNNINILNFDNLSSNLFNIAHKAKPDYVIISENNVTVVLDITVDKDLMLEGMLRELIRQIQVLRKQAGFNIEQRIYLQLSTTSDALKKVVHDNADKIMQEALVLEITELENPELLETCEISGEEITIKMKR